MHFAIMAAALLAQPTPASVETAPAAPAPVQAATKTGAKLWLNVQAGMSRTDVQRLHPAVKDKVHHKDELTMIEDYQVAQKCFATVRIFHEKGSVERVEVRGESSIGGRCSDTVMTALSSRYGESLSKESGGDGLFRRVNTAYVWHRDGVTLRFRKFNGSMFGGGGLGAPSWELTYSEVEDDVAL